jgi:hypothetical protein
LITLLLTVRTFRHGFDAFAPGTELAVAGIQARINWLKRIFPPDPAITITAEI